MKKHWILFGISGLLFAGCGGSGTDESTAKNKERDTVTVVETPEKTLPAAKPKQDPADFVPEGFRVFEKVYGDLDKDGVKDLILIIKGTDRGNFYQDEYRGELDRNRRGLIVLLNKKHGYEQVVKNLECFSSENEDGGVYYAPELSVSVEKGKLYVHYAHGRYGYWSYTFRYNQSDFDLIGYDASENHGPIAQWITSINFLTQKKQEKENISEDPEDEVFKETWVKLKTKKLLQLSEIKDFDEFSLPE
ncbi:hypothetical protein D3C87_95300 [compost metagenome]